MFNKIKEWFFPSNVCTKTPLKEGDPVHIIGTQTQSTLLDWAVVDGEKWYLVRVNKEAVYPYTETWLQVHEDDLELW